MQDERWNTLDSLFSFWECGVAMQSWLKANGNGSGNSMVDKIQ